MSRACRMSRVESAGRQHLRRRVDEVHWLQERLVEFVEVEARDVVVGVCYYFV